jgi:hypothetical protein
MHFSFMVYLVLLVSTLTASALAYTGRGNHLRSDDGNRLGRSVGWPGISCLRPETQFVALASQLELPDQPVVVAKVAVLSVDHVGDDRRYFRVLRS